MSKELNQNQIDEIYGLLIESKEKIEKNLKGISDSQDNLSSMDLNDEGDFAAASRDYNNDIHIKKQQLEELELINHALLKIKKGVFTGICEMCDSEIGMKRLRVKPYAKYCIDCRNHIDKK
ncbi:RNA polymerase-binding protein DksA [Halarcobacter sp.]|uniref:RNA polymerase-binding protein DksA n=1 Tax=Halarcobacter sp. TaxID=2321133 RepID=UPI002AA751B0|nr:RNA polymerase-binding protein DksA [Halarcobacter sp.]